MKSIVEIIVRCYNYATLEYEPWECTVQSGKSFIKAIGPQAHLVHAVSPINGALQLQHVADHTQSQRSGGCIDIFPLLCCSLLNLHQATRQMVTSHKTPSIYLVYYH